MLLIGICGRKRSGKGSIAEALEKQLGFCRYAFADKLKQVEKAMFSWIPDDVIWGADREHVVAVSPADMIELGAPGVITSRNIQQWLGQAVRKCMGEHAWINALVEQINTDAKPLVVIEDIRQPNEMFMVKQSGGYIIRANRNDRTGFHHYQPTSTTELISPEERCTHVFDGGAVCGRSAESHPISWTPDQHETEWALPDESMYYDRIINSSSGEEAAQHGINFAKQVMPNA
jgi:hypothetical protein